MIAGLFILSTAFLVFSLWLTAAFHRNRKKLPVATWRLELPRQASLSAGQAAALFASLGPSLTSQAPLSFEFFADGRQLQIRITAPITLERSLRAQFSACFPGSQLMPVDKPVTGIRTTIVPLQLAQSPLLPLRQSEPDGLDPVLPVLAALTGEADHSGVRLSLGPAPADWSAWSKEALAAVQAGMPLPPRGSWLVLYCWLSALGLSLPTSRSLQPEPTLLPFLAGKANSPVFAASLCAYTERDPGQRAKQLAAVLAAAFHDPTFNSLNPGTVRSISGSPKSIAAPDLILTAEEASALFHLPDEHHLVGRAHARTLPPSEKLIASLQRLDEPLLSLGVADAGHRRISVGLTISDRRAHTLVIGKTGTGKSTLLANLARQDLEAGRGVAVIDPHGDLAEQVLRLVPEHRAKELVYFNATDREYPVGFNLLGGATTESRPLVASSAVGVFKKLYGDSWGPRLEYILRNSILALLETPAPSLLLLPRLLTDPGYRRAILRYVQDPLLRTFFLEEYESYDPRFRSEAIAAVLNKVGQFLSSPTVRNIVGQSAAGVQLREVMDSGGIFIANLASGRIGEDNAGLLGGLLVAGFQLAAMGRANQPETERQDFHLLADEFQHFANDAFASILSEARKYRLALTLSHQFLDQVPDELSEAVFGNVGTLAAFRVGAGDIGRLAKEFAPSFDGQDLVHLPNHQFCLRLIHQGTIVPAFTAHTVPLSTPTTEVGGLVALSRQRYGRPRPEVELEIIDTWERRIDP